MNRYLKVLCAVIPFMYGGTYWFSYMFGKIEGYPEGFPKGYAKSIFSKFDIPLFGMNIFPIIPLICLVVGLYFFYSMIKDREESLIN